MPSDPEASSSKDVTETTPLVTKGPSDSEAGAAGVDDAAGKGASWLRRAALLLSCEVPAAAVALPRALVKTGWMGVPIILLVALMSVFSRRRLGDCLARLARSPQRRDCYAAVAEEALGKKWSAAVSLATMGVRFGSCAVLLLLAAQLLQTLLRPLAPFTYCMWLLVSIATVAPLVLLTARRHFALLGMVSLVTIASAGALYLVQLFTDIKPFGTFRYGLHGLSDVSLALGMVFFAFGGACASPGDRAATERRSFNDSSLYSVCILLCLYLPLAIAGYAILGESTAPNLAQSLTATPLTFAANVLLLVHLLAAFLLIIQPVCQEAEDLYNIQTESVGRRAAVRVSLLLALLFVAASVPRFYTLLPLIGGAAALLTAVLPSVCYLRLPPGDAQSADAGWVRTVCWEVAVAGGIAGAAAAFSAIGAIFGTSLATPCYFK